MSKKTEELLEEMTKVEPVGLTPEAHRLYITICGILNDNENLIKYKNRCDGAIEYINDRQNNMIPEHYEDLMHILTQSKEGEW